MKVSKVSGLSLVALLVLSASVFAWNDKKTHPQITDKAIGGKFHLDEFVKEQLNLRQGIGSSITHPEEGEMKRIEQ